MVETKRRAPKKRKEEFKVSEVVSIKDAPQLNESSFKNFAVHEALESAEGTESSFIDSYFTQYPTHDLRRLFKRVIQMRENQEQLKGFDPDTELSENWRKGGLKRPAKEL